MLADQQSLPLRSRQLSTSFSDPHAELSSACYRLLKDRSKPTLQEDVHSPCCGTSTSKSAPGCSSAESFQCVQSHESEPAVGDIRCGRFRRDHGVGPGAADPAWRAHNVLRPCGNRALLIERASRRLSVSGLSRFPHAGLTRPPHRGSANVHHSLGRAAPVCGFRVRGLGGRRAGMRGRVCSA